MQIIKEEMPQTPALILALGTKAIESAHSLFPDTPLVSSMILNGDNIPKSRAPSVSILLQIPPATQMHWLAQFLPEVKKVGILYDPEQSSDVIRAFQDLPMTKGIEIIPVKVNSAKQLRSSLQYISTHTDALLAIPDGSVYSGKTAKEVLLFTYRNRIPFVGLSATWVKAGALYALEANYSDIGKKSAESAHQLLSGQPVAKPPLISNDNVSYTINSRTAKHLRLDIETNLISGSLKVF